MELLQLVMPIILPVAILGGFFIGSFLNVLADRLPKGEDVLWTRSHCDRCNTPLAWYELIPILSFLMLGMKCRHCRTRLSWEYPLVELATGLLFGGVTVMYGVSDPVLFLSMLLITSALIVIFIADLKYYIIPDSMIVIACIASLGLLIGKPVSLVGQHVATAVIATGFFYLLWIGTNKRGMGFGDVKLAFFIGLFVGFPQIITALYVAFLTGAVIGIILMIGHHKTLKSRVPFGPFLIVGLVGSFFISIPNLIGL